MSMQFPSSRILCLDLPGAGALRLGEDLGAHGFATEFVTNPAEAAARLRTAEIAFDIIIAERTAGALDLLDEAGLLETPLILLDSFGTQKEALAFTKSGITKVMARPFTSAAIGEACRNLLVDRENAELRGSAHFGGIESRDPIMLRLLELAERVAATHASLLLQGQSGTGKTRLARAVHQHSPRRAKPFVEVNCGAMPADLLMSELFGHVRGAFTGAEADREGKFEAADGGTLFLDEIASASPDMQVKLLRVLESGCFERVGENKTRKVDVRLIAACNQDLASEIEAGRFRADLYWRLNVVALEMPCLESRPGDLIDLATHFQKRFAREHGRDLEVSRPLSTPVQAVLLAHNWPGNVRELENNMERAVLFCSGNSLEPEDFGALFTASPSHRSSASDWPAELRLLIDAPPGPLKQALAAPEAYLVRCALEATGGNRQQTAALLEINRSTLFNKMRKFGLTDFPTATISPVLPTRSGPAQGDSR